MEHILAKALGRDVAQLAPEEKRQLLGRLLGRLAHEIRNPLSSLDIHSQLLEEDLGELAPEVREKLAPRLEINPQAALTNLAFLRLVTPKEEVYLGEAFPVELQLYWQNAENVQMPQLPAEGFSLGQASRPAQSTTLINGMQYNVAVFKMSATPAKPGLLTLGPAECSLTVLVPLQNARRRDRSRRTPRPELP